MTQEKKSLLRRALMGLGLLVTALVAGWLYFTSGRYMETDNAYIRADILSIAPEISGTIVTVPVKDNQNVHKGDTLFTIDPSSFQIALDMANANLATAQSDIEALKARYRQKEQDLKLASAQAELADRNYQRRYALQQKNKIAISVEEVETSSADLTTAKQKMAVVEQERDEMLAELQGNADIPTVDHPKYKAALAARDRAELDLKRTTVVAPMDGVTGTMPKLGDYARASIPAMNLVNSAAPWVEANFKETELTSMQPGQKVEIKVDTYPSAKWEGTVQSISPASGAEFSVLPAQNATGNWVKVVQRIPVRIAIKPEEGQPPLISGMSTLVTVDTGHFTHLPQFMQGGSEESKVASK